MIIVKVDKCVGCKSCEIACSVEHSQSKELYEAIHETPAPRTRISVEPAEGFAVPLQCRHCEDAPCIAICPTKAMHRSDEESPVLVDSEVCVGCKYCMLACPYGVISFDAENKVVTKCDQCFERVERGEEPACVVACPTGALEFGAKDDIAAKKGKKSSASVKEKSTAGAC